MQIFDLWENNIPYYDGGEIPKLTYYKASQKKGRGAVIICPGGAYAIRSPHEGEGYAAFLNKEGLDAFVLDYRVAPSKYPAALCDARRAIRFVRHNAERFGIDPEKIAIMGSSAGGHLAAHAASYIGEISGEACDEIDRESYVPNAQILCYPVIDFEGHAGSYENLLGEKLDSLRESVTPLNIVTKSAPPAYMWHTSSDETVDVCNTYRYAERLKKLDVPVEMHIYPVGPHGIGLATEDTPNRPDGASSFVPHVQTWSALLIKWLCLYGFFN